MSKLITSAISKLTEENVQLRAVLEEIEWCDIGDDWVCPCCKNLFLHHNGKHEKDCKLNKALQHET